MTCRLTNLSNSAATGAGALAHTLAPARTLRLLEVRMHLSAAATQDTLTLTIDSALGAAYDSVLDSQDMTGLSEYVFRPTTPVILMKGDEIDFSWTNTDGRTFGLEAIYQEL